jgi:hypothetical protein
VAEALAGRDGGLDGALDPARFVAGAGPVFERLEGLGRGGGRGLLASASSPATGAGR